MNNKTTILKNIYSQYDKRNMLQSELAALYSLNKCDISTLCSAAGFYRGKRIKTVSLSMLLQDTKVQRILARAK